MTTWATAGAREYRQELTAAPEVLGAARRVVAAYLRYWGWGEVVDEATLCTTEMLANVAKHTESLACVLTLEDTGAGVRLTVSDTSQQVPVRQRSDMFAESGRGMNLIAAAADQFGSAVTPTGKDVWAVFGVRAGAVT